jgi:hypothetical protein
MSQVYSIALGLPFCQSYKGEETKLSIALRVTFFALGAIAIIAGTLVVTGSLVVGDLSTIYGWLILAPGIVFTTASILIKYIKKQVDTKPKVIITSEAVAKDSTPSSSSALKDEGVQLNQEPEKQIDKPANKGSSDLNAGAANVQVSDINSSIEDPEDVEEISIETLRAVQSQDIYKLLQDSLRKAANRLMPPPRHLSPNEFNNVVWLSAIYEIMLDGKLDEEGFCHTLLQLGDCYVKDAIPIKQGDISFNSVDWFSSQGMPCLPVTLKKNINALSATEKSTICLLIEGGATATQNLLTVIDGLNEIVQKLQNRYPFFATGNRGDPIVYTGFENTKKFLPTIIFDFLKTIIANEVTNEDDLSNPEYAKKICSLLAIKLLSSAKVDRINKSLFIEKLKIEFGSLDRGAFFDPKIPNFIINDLTSFDYDDALVVDTQPLELAIHLSEMDQIALQDLIKKIKNSEKIEGKIATLLNPIAQLLLDRYFKNFMSSYLQKKQNTLQPLPKVANARKEEPKEEIRNKNQKVQNDIFGDHYKKLIEKNFVVYPSWSLSGSCVLSAILKAVEPGNNYAIDPTAGYQRIDEIRTQLANYLLENQTEFVAFFADVNAFHMHVTHLQSRATYLEDIDLLALSQVLKRPLFVYKRKVDTFFINDRGEPLPSVIFGEDLKGKPIRLYDEHEHYKLLTKK